MSHHQLGTFLFKCDECGKEETATVGARYSYRSSSSAKCCHGDGPCVHGASDSSKIDARPTTLPGGWKKRHPPLKPGIWGIICDIFASSLDCCPECSLKEEVGQ